LPSSVKDVRREELRVLQGAKLRVKDLNNVLKPVTKQGIHMICPGQDIKCLTYNMWDVLEDLLNDGDHAQHAQFKFKLERDPITGSRIYNELWTGEWWRHQQANLGPKKNVLAIIPYMDETPVTLNGRNMHPVYVSLGNLHTTFRFSPNSIEII
jgi:hypothetical protein